MSWLGCNVPSKYTRGGALPAELSHPTEHSQCRGKGSSHTPRQVDRTHPVRSQGRDVKSQVRQQASERIVLIRLCPSALSHLLTCIGLSPELRSGQEPQEGSCLIQRHTHYTEGEQSEYIGQSCSFSNLKLQAFYKLQTCSYKFSSALLHRAGRDS